MPGNGVSSQGKRVLLVEDDPAYADLLRAILLKEKDPLFNLVSANGLESGLADLAKGGIDAVLLDLSLPDSQGLDTFNRVYAQAPEVPIVVLSGLDDETMAIKAVQEGAQDYLVKGQVDNRMLLRAIRYAIARQQAEEQIKRHMQRLAVLREINQAITSSLDLRAVLDILLEKMDLLLPYSALMVWLLNRETGVLERVACRNLNEEEWKGRKLIIKPPLPQSRGEYKTPVAVSYLQTDPRTRNPEFYRKHGLVSYLGVPLIAKGTILGTLSFLTRKEHQFVDDEVEFLSTVGDEAAIAIYNSQLYERAKKQAVELKKANKVKSEFLGVMSHELRTPLNIIMGFAGMVQDGMLGEINQKQGQALEKIVRNSNDLLAMVDTILEATTMEAREVKVERHEVQLRNFLGELRSIYNMPLDKEIALRWDYPSNLPVLKTDRGKLKQILQNLINNAIKFTPKGTVTVSARYSAEAEAVELKVADTGIGIPREGLPVIFDRFHQVDSTEKRSYGGVGLGLHIVKEFTEPLGGKVSVESEVGKGSVFTVILPILTA